MPQTQYHLDTPLSPDEAKKLSNKASDFEGVMFITVNVDGQSIVVTHKDNYNEDAFKSEVGL